MPKRKRQETLRSKKRKKIKDYSFNDIEEKAIIRRDFGSIIIASSLKGIRFITFSKEKLDQTPIEDIKNLFLKRCVQQLNDYFNGKRKEFHCFFIPIDHETNTIHEDAIPLDIHGYGSPFQRRVWESLFTIPFGQTCSYSDIAERIGSPKAVRAVGNANGKNMFPIIVPCHRVIHKNGSLGGYTGGLKYKKWLLNHEGIEL